MWRLWRFHSRAQVQVSGVPRLRPLQDMWGQGDAYTTRYDEDYYARFPWIPVWTTRPTWTTRRKWDNSLRAGYFSRGFDVIWWLFFKINFFKRKFRNTIRVSNGLDLDQDWRIVGPARGPNCLQRLLADDKVIFHAFVVVCWLFFQNKIFLKILSGTIY